MEWSHKANLYPCYIRYLEVFTIWPRSTSGLTCVIVFLSFSFILIWFDWCIECWWIDTVQPRERWILQPGCPIDPLWMEGTTATSQTQYCCSGATHWPSRICAKLRSTQRSFDTIILFTSVLHFKCKMWLWLGMSGETLCMVISYSQYDCIYSTNQPLHANPWIALAVLIWMELHDCMLYCDLQWSAKTRLISQSIGRTYHPLIWSQCD